MKKIVLISLIVLAFSSAIAQDEPYRGGIADGHASSEIIIPFSDPIAFQAFKGGNADGHATDSLINLVFAYPPQFYAFLGGDADGWAGTLTTAIVLPVRIMEFNGFAQNNFNKLQWKTSSEQNSHYFVIQRSKNGVQYDSIGKVIAAGNSNILKSYSFTDSFPHFPSNFYRLKMVDIDGSFEYSTVILLKTNIAGFSVKAYPNPVQDIIQLQLPTAYTTAIPCLIFDAVGKIVFKGIIPAGNAKYMFNVSKLAHGRYYLQLQLPDAISIIPLSK